MQPTIPGRGGPSGSLRHQNGIAGKTVMGGKRRRMKLKKDTIRGIMSFSPGKAKPDIRRLARRGGVKRISGHIYDDVRKALKMHLGEIIGLCVIYTEYRQAKTVTVNDVIHSLKHIGKPIYGFDPDIRHSDKK